MTFSLVNKTLVRWLILGLSGLTFGCSMSDGNTTVHLQNQPQEGGGRAEAVESTVGGLQSQLLGHLMTNASRQLGWMRMELKHGSPSEEHWSEADKDARSKCREWGYEEAEVTGTNHYEFSGSSTSTSAQ